MVGLVHRPIMVHSQKNLKHVNLCHLYLQLTVEEKCSLLAS